MNGKGASTTDPRYLGPWPDLRAFVESELSAFAATATRPEVAVAPTRCRPWIGAQLTAHVAATFTRFVDMLERSRSGDLSPPFAPDELSAVNLAAVSGDGHRAVTDLTAAVEQFCRLAVDPAEIMAHQLGPIPVGLQLGFGLGELVLHHDDLAHTGGRSYRPEDGVVDVLVPVWANALQRIDVSPGDDHWAAIMSASGR